MWIVLFHIPKPITLSLKHDLEFVYYRARFFFGFYGLGPLPCSNSEFSALCFVQFIFIAL